MDVVELCNYTQKPYIRTFEIEAIQIPIVYNKYGDHDPDGLLYVLSQDADRIQMLPSLSLNMVVSFPSSDSRNVRSMPRRIIRAPRHSSSPECTDWPAS